MQKGAALDTRQKQNVRGQQNRSTGRKPPVFCQAVNNKLMSGLCVQFKTKCRNNFENCIKTRNSLP